MRNRFGPSTYAGAIYRKTTSRSDLRIAIKTLCDSLNSGEDATTVLCHFESAARALERVAETHEIKPIIGDAVQELPR